MNLERHLFLQRLILFFLDELVICSIVVVSKVDSEVAERIGVPSALRRLESEAGWVHQRNDGQRHARVGQINAADATVVLDQAAQEVLVGDAFGMDCGLNTRHHELILG